MGEKRFIISDAAKLVDVESHVLRYWEEELGIDISATLDVKRMCLTDIYCWDSTTKEWEAVNPIKEEKARQWKLKSVPFINSKENAVFVYDEETKEFKQA